MPLYNKLGYVAIGGRQRQGVAWCNVPYQVALVILTLLTAAGGLWLVAKPPSIPEPDLAMTVPDRSSMPLSGDIVSNESDPQDPALVNINTAPGLEGLRRSLASGSALAPRIGAYRDESGPFPRSVWTASWRWSGSAVPSMRGSVASSGLVIEVCL